MLFFYLLNFSYTFFLNLFLFLCFTIVCTSIFCLIFIFSFYLFHSHIHPSIPSNILLLFWIHKTSLKILAHRNGNTEKQSAPRLIDFFVVKTMIQPPQFWTIRLINNTTTGNNADRRWIVFCHESAIACQERTSAKDWGLSSNVHFPLPLPTRRSHRSSAFAESENIERGSGKDKIEKSTEHRPRARGLTLF